MTPQEINIVAAEARGWKWYRFEASRIISRKQDKDVWFMLLKTPVKRDGKLIGKEVTCIEFGLDADISDIPNIHSNANAQRDAFLEMSERNRRDFVLFVLEKAGFFEREMTTVGGFLLYQKAYHSHFSECYLKALNKWKD